MTSAWADPLLGQSPELTSTASPTLPPPEELAGWWYIYLTIVLVCTTFQVITTVFLIKVTLTEVWKICTDSGRGVKVVKDHVSALVPCYMPNEAAIIKDTVTHLLERITHIDHLDVYIVYNTPHDMDEIDAELQAIARSELAPGRRLFVKRVMESTSKADNLNHIIPHLQGKHAVIYDADHHPDPASLALAINHLEAGNYDCVQGSTYIREGCCLLRQLVHAEFFLTYFVALPVMEAITGLAFFAGSNAVWRTSSLKKLRFDHAMLTEDIEFTLRSILDYDFTFGFLPESRSGELAPAGCRALWKQRLRWAMGWDQVTLRHTAGFCSKDLPLSRRLGLAYIFVLRWLFHYSSFVVVLFNTTSAIAVNLGEEPSNFQPTVITQIQHLSLYLFLAIVGACFMQIIIQEPRVSTVLGMALYFWLLPVALALNTVVLTTSLLKVTFGGSTTWVVTTRSSATTGPQYPALPRLTKEGLVAARVVLGVALCLLGSVGGGMIGAFVGRHEVVHKHTLKLWGLIPYGTTSTTSTVIDGKIVAVGSACGACFGLFLLFLLHFIAIRHCDADAVLEREDNTEMTVPAVERAQHETELQGLVQAELGDENFQPTDPSADYM